MTEGKHNQSSKAIPRISVILPVYNGGDYLKASVESVLKQKFIDFEFLILDDCSTDKSWEYLNGLDDDRITLFKNETNKGLFYNLNYLIKESATGLIKLWSQDDIMYQDCLQQFVTFHAAHPGIGFSYSGRDMIDENGIINPNNLIDTTPAIISPTLHARIAYYTGSIAGNIANVCINKAALDKVGFFNEGMKISADFDMWVRLAEDHNTGFIKEKLIQLRDHSSQLSRTENLYINHVKEDMNVYRYLNSYVSAEVSEEGRMLLRKYKLVFYYTLMIKALLRGKIKTAYLFFKELARFDNIFKISVAFGKAKLSTPPKPRFYIFTKPRIILEL